MTIKGTLETFHLPDLLQMLAFNQKEGTLVLETGSGPRTLCVERGTFGYVEGDPTLSRAAARILRRSGLVPADRLARAEAIADKSGRYVGDALLDLGAIDAEQRGDVTLYAISEATFDLILASLSRFEFVEGRRLSPSGVEAKAIVPLLAVDGFLIDLSRKMDEWAMLRKEIASDDEVFERTSVPPDLSDLDVERAVVDRVLPLFDGTRALATVVAESDQDRFAVVKAAAHLLRQGALKAADTPSLSARAEELSRRGREPDALSLLRLAVARGDADPTLRQRLAAALTAVGDRAGAAAELEAYARAIEAADPVAAFDALVTAQDLRGDDVASTARTCDLYLAHAVRLSKRAEIARRALRALVAAATAAQKPAEAAARLAQFLERGDAPMDDLLVLSDLWAAAGRRSDAAQALVRRAELLLHHGRMPAAREVLRRAVTLDPSRVDARRRLGDLERSESRRRHRRRLAILAGLFVLTAASAGAVYLVHDGRASKTTESSVAKVESAAVAAETTGAEALAAFERVVDGVANGTAPDGALPGAVATLQRVCETVAKTLRLAVTDAELEIRELTGPRATSAIDRLRDIEARRVAIVTRATIGIQGVAQRAGSALEQGEKAYAAGRFRDARSLLLQAERLSSDDPMRASRARRSRDAVEAYMEGFAHARTDFDAALASGRTDEAWRLGCRILATYLDSDLTRELLLPVPATSTPTSAQLRVGAATDAVATPTVLRYSPFGETGLAVRAPGCVPQSFTLPTYAQIRAAEATQALPPQRIDAVLVSGPRWTSPAKAAAGPFDVGDALWFVGADGTSLHTLRPSDGTAFEARAVPAIPDRVRSLGRAPAGGLWLLAGLRTYIHAPEGSSSWQHQTSGRLERSPTIADGTLLLADDTGVLVGLDPATGASKWRTTLDAAPVQAPVATSLGFLLATASGDVVLVAPRDGKASVLLPGAARRPTLVAPWEFGAIVLGGAHGLAEIAPGGAVSRVLGEADPDPALGLLATREAIVWVERSGSVRALVRGGAAAIDVGGVGVAATTPALRDGLVVAVGRDRMLRAALLTAPASTSWKTRLPADVASPPVIVGDLVVVRTSAGIAAFER